MKCACTGLYILVYSYLAILRSTNQKRIQTLGHVYKRTMKLQYIVVAYAKIHQNWLKQLSDRSATKSSRTIQHRRFSAIDRIAETFGSCSALHFCVVSAIRKKTWRFLENISSSGSDRLPCNFTMEQPIEANFFFKSLETDVSTI